MVDNVIGVPVWRESDLESTDAELLPDLDKGLGTEKVVEACDPFGKLVRASDRQDLSNGSCDEAARGVNRILDEAELAGMVSRPGRVASRHASRAASSSSSSNSLKSSSLCNSSSSSSKRLFAAIPTASRFRLLAL